LHRCDPSGFHCDCARRAEVNAHAAQLRRERERALFGRGGWIGPKAAGWLNGPGAHKGTEQISRRRGWMDS
jgi:hypothetical protein